MIITQKKRKELKGSFSATISQHSALQLIKTVPPPQPPPPPPPPPSKPNVLLRTKSTGSEKGLYKLRAKL